MLELNHADPNADSMKPMLCLKEKDIDFHTFDQHERSVVKAALAMVRYPMPGAPAAAAHPASG